MKVVSRMAVNPPTQLRARPPGPDRKRALPEELIDLTTYPPMINPGPLDAGPDVLLQCAVTVLLRELSYWVTALCVTAL